MELILIQLAVSFLFQKTQPTFIASMPHADGIHQSIYNPLPIAVNKDAV